MHSCNVRYDHIPNIPSLLVLEYFFRVVYSRLLGMSKRRFLFMFLLGSEWLFKLRPESSYSVFNSSHRLVKSHPCTYVFVGWWWNVSV